MEAIVHSSYSPICDINRSLLQWRVKHFHFRVQLGHGLDFRKQSSYVSFLLQMMDKDYHNVLTSFLDNASFLTVFGFSFFLYI